MALVHPIEELDRLQARSTSPLSRAMVDLADAQLHTDAGGTRAALERIGTLIEQTVVLGSLLGARRLLLEADAAELGARSYQRRQAVREFARATTPLIDPIRFEEAIADMLRREPRLAFGYKQVQVLYATKHAVAAAKSVDLEVTQNVQRLLGEALAGRSRESATQAIADVGARIEGWTKSYADTVYATNIATSYTAGRFVQAQDPDIQEVFGAFELVTAGDVDVRPNHAAAEGLVAPLDSKLWDRFAPALGYNCRCGLEMVDRWELGDRGLLRQGQVLTYYPPTFSAAHPDPGFGRGRPDRWLAAA